MIIKLDTSKLDGRFMKELIGKIQDAVTLERLSEIDDYTYHGEIISNPYASSNVIRKIYDKYPEYFDINRKALYNPNTPEDIILNILENWKNILGRSALEAEILENENITSKTIEKIYFLHEAGGLNMSGFELEKLLADERTPISVLRDILEKHPKNKSLVLVVAMHPKMKIVPVSDTE